MLSQSEAARAVGTTAYDCDGVKLGRVGQVFLGDEDGEPRFVTVQTGLLGRHETLVPLTGSSLEPDGLVVAYPTATVQDAPVADLDGGHLAAADEERLLTYYGQAGARRVSVTRSEEHLTAGVAAAPVSRVRLRKYVVVEEETITVPVRRERVVMESVPIEEGYADPAGPTELAAFADGTVTGEGTEVVLHEERVVVTTVTQPVERVRLAVETFTAEESVSAPVRREQVVVEGGGDDQVVTRGGAA